MDWFFVCLQKFLYREYKKRYIQESRQDCNLIIKMNFFKRIFLQHLFKLALTKDSMTGENNESVPIRTQNPADTTDVDINPKDRKREAHWPAVLFYIHLNILGLYGIIILFTQTSFTTVIFSKKLQNQNDCGK